MITLHANGTIEGINNSNFNSSLPAGHMIQLVTASTTTQVDWSSGWTDTGLTANITPQFANSKIIMTVFCQTHIAGSYDHGIGYKFLRGSTAIMTTATNKWQYFYDNSTSYQERGSSVLSFEDTSHNSTSALTYKVQFISMTSASSNAVSFCRDTSRASMELVEIKV